ncbi:MAG TPA: hypothetical protein VHE34_09855 [Puia sp.]|uniref:hypothetical protein n=1 Tax=Puia sp. TaxID=2045100 RepID=UPI002CB081C2|nr:hypothetical protein [Puia sp.]HVU95519.1 hypothetical protein [Puia sp.]
MKTRSTRSRRIAFGVAFGLICLGIGCIKNLPFGGSTPVNPKPVYDLDVLLLGLSNSEGTGFIKFRQDPDSAGIITLATSVNHLEPDHAYILERAVNPFADTTGCSSTAWLKLGAGLAPLSIHTDAHGNGDAGLWRDVSAIPAGTAFHIHFQVVDSASSATVLVSDCYNYVVR